MKLAAMPTTQRLAIARSRSMREAWIVGAASLTQVALMAWLFRTENVTATGLVAVGLAFAVGWGWGRNRIPAVARVAVVTAALGGLGMLVGTWIDTAQSAASTAASVAGEPAMPPCHVRETTTEPPALGQADEPPSHELGKMVTSWMFVLMLIGCAGGCTCLCDECEPRWHRRLLEPLGCTPGMILGMMLGGNLAGSFAAWSGLGASVAMHVTMVGGMAVGSATSRALLWSIAQARHANLSASAP